MILETEIKEILNKVNNNSEKCFKLLKKQFPLLIKEVYVWEFIKSLSNFGFIILLGVGSLVVALILKGMFLLLIIPTIISLYISSKYIDWLQILVAKRLFMINYIKNMIPEKEPNYN